MCLKRIAAVLTVVSSCALSSGCAAPERQEAREESSAAIGESALVEVSTTTLDAIMVEYNMFERLVLDSEGMLFPSAAADAKDAEQATRTLLKASAARMKLMEALERQFPKLRFVIEKYPIKMNPTQVKALAAEVNVVRKAIIEMTPEAFAKALPGAIKRTWTISLRALELLNGAGAAATRVTTALLEAAGKRLALTCTAAELASGAGLVLSRANVIAMVALTSYQVSSFVVAQTGFDAYLVDRIMGDAGADLGLPSVWQTAGNDAYGNARDTWRGLNDGTTKSSAQWQGRATAIARLYFRIKYIEKSSRPEQTETASLEAFLGFLSNSALNDPNDPAPMTAAGTDVMAKLASEHEVDWTAVVEAALKPPTAAESE